MLRWILDHEEVSTTIPGAKTASQVWENAQASSLSRLSEQDNELVREVYTELVAQSIEAAW